MTNTKPYMEPHPCHYNQANQPCRTNGNRNTFISTFISTSIHRLQENHIIESNKSISNNNDKHKTIHGTSPMPLQSSQPSLPHQWQQKHIYFHVYFHKHSPITRESHYRVE